VSKGEDDTSRIRAIQAAAQRALAYFRENGVPDPKDVQNTAASPNERYAPKIQSPFLLSMMWKLLYGASYRTKP